MPIAASDLKPYLSANRPTDDVGTSGGAISATSRPLDSQFAASGRPEIVSANAADTMNVTIVGRNAAGDEITETKALNGTTPVLFDATYERILRATIASAAAGTVLLKQGAGGATRHTFAAGELVAAIFFQGSASDPDVQTLRYEKKFWKNNHGSLSLTSAELTLTDDPDDRFHAGTAPSVNDTASVTDRTTAPASVTFVDDDVAQSVPGGSLAAGAAIGRWFRQTLAAAAAPAKSTLTDQISGQTT
jgi:hypothetical protein